MNVLPEWWTPINHDDGTEEDFIDPNQMEFPF